METGNSNHVAGHIVAKPPDLNGGNILPTVAGTNPGDINQPARIAGIGDKGITNMNAIVAVHNVGTAGVSVGIRPVATANFKTVKSGSDTG